LRDKGGIRGFTLLEVMVAIAILGIALTCVLQIFSGGLDCAKRSGEYTRAVLYAKAKMEELISRSDLTEGEESGEFDSDYRWHTEIRPAELQCEEHYKNLPIQLYELTVKVSWVSDDKERDVELNTLKSLAG